MRGNFIMIIIISGLHFAVHEVFSQVVSHFDSRHDLRWRDVTDEKIRIAGAK